MEGKPKLAVLAGSVILLVAVVAAIAVTVSHGRSGAPAAPGGLDATSKAVKSICQPTDYKQTCEETLAAAAGNTSDPKELVRLAFQVAEDHIRQGLHQSSLVLELEKDKLSREALQTCWELLDASIDDLNTSVERYSNIDFSNIDDAVDDLHVWISSAMTYQETCLDGFEGTPGTAGASMREALKTAQELTANVLQIVNKFGAALEKLQLPAGSRRLLSDQTADGFPSWLSVGKRRLLAQAPWEVKPNVVVAQDGSGDYKTINEALAVVPPKGKGNGTFVIYIKAGVYEEYVNITKYYTNLAMIGDGPDKTKITGSRSVIANVVTTFQTAPFGVACNGFLAKGLAFENTAGPEKHQAVALRVQGDRSVFYNCRMDAYQDTLYAFSKRQFYRDCTISGTVDFIFGNARSVFQNCHIIARKPMANQQNIFTAHGRKLAEEPTAIVFHNCTLSGEPALLPVAALFPTFLGRPWKPYARTIVLQSQIDAVVDPKGWLAWNGGVVGQDTCFYSEFDNRGAGSSTAGRVKWPGVKAITYDQAQMFSVQNFLGASDWLPNTGVPFFADLMPASA